MANGHVLVLRLTMTSCVRENTVCKNILMHEREGVANAFIHTGIRADTALALHIAEDPDACCSFMVLLGHGVGECFERQCLICCYAQANAFFFLVCSILNGSCTSCYNVRHLLI